MVNSKQLIVASEKKAQELQEKDNKLADLEKQFTKAMVSICNRAKTECQYNATYLLKMISKEGGLKTAKHLLNAKFVSEGFEKLFTLKRLDLTVEALVLTKPWCELFNSKELEIAIKRLNSLGYKLKLNELLSGIVNPQV